MSTFVHVPHERFDEAITEMLRVVEPGAPLGIGTWGGLDFEGVPEFGELRPYRFFSLASHDRWREMLARHAEVELFETYAVDRRPWLGVPVRRRAQEALELFRGPDALVEHGRVDVERPHRLAVLRPLHPRSLDVEDGAARLRREPAGELTDMTQVWLTVGVRDEPDVDVPGPVPVPVVDPPVDAVGVLLGVAVPSA